MEKAYRRSIYCGEEIHQEGGKLESKYCGKSWCLVCARIRTAKAIEVYGPEVEAWSDRFMLTLTAPTVPGDQLRAEIDRRLKLFRLCSLSLRRQGTPAIGIRKLEVTYNPETDLFHPHFHFLCDNEAAARAFRDAWLQRIPEADPGAQHLQRADKGGVVELLKYATKMTTPTRRKGVKEFVALSALDTIFRALKGKRIYQTIGFELAGADALEADELEVSGMAATKRITEVISWSWEPELTDWVDRLTGETLTGYSPGMKFADFVESIGKCNSSYGVQIPLNEPSLPSG